MSTGSDFVEIVNQPITFGVSDFEMRVTVQTNADSLVEGTESFTARLTPVTDRVVIAENTADISIEETTNGKFAGYVKIIVYKLGFSNSCSGVSAQFIHCK